jgi:hypothetical protein
MSSHISKIFENSDSDSDIEDSDDYDAEINDVIDDTNEDYEEEESEEETSDDEDRDEEEDDINRTSNKQTIKESNDRTLSFNTNSIPHQPVSKPSVNPKQAYMEILGDIAKGPKSGFEGEFKVQGHVDPINGSLPEGQLGLDQIMGLINK